MPEIEDSGTPSPFESSASWPGAVALLLLRNFRLGCGSVLSAPSPDPLDYDANRLHKDGICSMVAQVGLANITASIRLTASLKGCLVSWLQPELYERTSLRHS